MPLNDAKIRNLKTKEKAYKVADFDGQFLLVKATGSKSWRFKYRIEGKEKLLVIGDYPAISLLQARQIRDAARAEIAAGGDPQETKQEQKRIRRESQGHTFEKVAAAFLDKQHKEGKSPATLSKTEYHLKLANRDFGRKPISEITSPMVLRCLRKVEAKVGSYLLSCQATRQGNPDRFLPKFCCAFRSHSRSPFAHNTRLKERHNSATGPVPIMGSVLTNMRSEVLPLVG